ncbi:type I DNA topoisomerase [Granulicella tundricola]|uniref:DNA topoisomerase 1 n=1 Tax=Granulicella tundricola (strain ATCC BAA-1859 / DSM 23138 / MP5ACTX9) TaxID=1198114 RepID=E8WXU9_GRATM|nr:type I DNA topoisomerase [Granulicella tundricola]ADW69794.1 DNA topoisomerase I [Granulicella tundricola MP5ACTX9]
MSKSLVIVESPAKAKTINKYLGADYTVEASLGHIMDLPKSDIGVELLNRTFAPTLIVSPGKEKIVDRLKKLAAKADHIFLAPDPDREGEAIAAHLAMQLRPVIKAGADIRRVTFNEITQKAVKAAFLKARDVNENLVDAQQTRRVLDRLVGYQISPLLWDKVRRGLSAGRVQTVALRLIVEREREINAFVPVEYWTVDAVLQAEKTSFTARLTGIDGARITVPNGFDKDGKAQVLANALPDHATTDQVVADLANATFAVKTVEKKERKQNPKAPFTTSKLQQEAAGRLGFNVRRTMGVAQRLYEGIEIGGETVGLITYMRTDSTRVSDDAVAEARTYIGALGERYLPAKPNEYKKKNEAQDAHEAIRPTNVAYHPDEIRASLSDEQYKLYRLIWMRFVASQMMPAIFDQTTVEIGAKAARSYDFRVSGSVLKFDGFLKVYETAPAASTAEASDEDGEEEDKRLPALADGQGLVRQAIEHEQKFTDPPPRFNEASLVKTLEEKGIGRPSTYASIINTIQDRDYVKKIGNKFVPTEIGMVVTELLVKNFPYIFETGYTATLEGELDAVEAGTEKWTDLLDGFYSHLEKELAVAETTMEDIKRKEEATDEVCDNCGSPLILKWGKFGSFFACSAFSKAKAVTIAAAPWKKDPKAVLKKILGSFHFPMIVKAVTFDETNFSKEVADAKEFAEAVKSAAGKGKKITAEPVSCDFTKENFAAKPDLNAPGADEAPEEEFCDNCGRLMVLKNGPWGPFMSCPGYSDDPPCKTIRKLTQKVQSKPPITLDEPCPKCGKPLLQRDGAYGEFIACSGYPKCKYVKQELLDVKCPKDGGDLAVRKTKRGDVFYGCVNYPKCDFASNLKLVNETCPKCHSAYLLEYGNKEGTYLVCPNNREFLPKRRPKKGQPVEVPTTPECTYERLIGPPKTVEAEPEMAVSAA